MNARCMRRLVACMVLKLGIATVAWGQTVVPWEGLTQAGLGMNEAGDRFGEAAAVGDFDGDGLDDLAVGAPNEAPDDKPSGGAVFVFRGTRDGLRPWHTLDQKELGAIEIGDLFGRALVAGDFNDDGIDDLAIGAPNEAPATDPASGYVFLFKGTRSGLVPWSSFGQEGLGTNEAGDQFGVALAAGDFDDDGRADLAVGAPGEALGSTRSGSVFVFRGSAGGLSAWHSLDQDGLGSNEQGDGFGTALVAADFNGDQRVDLAVGAPGEAVGNSRRAGYVFIFRGTSRGLRTWDAVGQAGLESDEAGDRFGTSLSAGDFDGDGLPDLAVGAPGEAGPSMNSGAVYVYRRSGSNLGGWMALDQSGLGRNEAFDQFGSALASGDFDQDGFADLAIGAPGESPGGDPRSGAVFVFHGSPSRLQPRSSITQVGLGANENGDLFGAALVSGDFNGAGAADLAVGAWGEAPGSDPVSGAVFLFRGTDDPWKPIIHLADFSNPTISGHSNGRLYVAAVGSGGELRLAESTSPGEWATVSVPPGPPPHGFDPNTSPVLVREGEELHLLIRGADNELYHSVRRNSNPWSSLTQLTSDARVLGEFSVATGTVSGQVSIHVGHYAGEDRVRYIRMVGGTTTSRYWNNARQIQIGQVSDSEILVTVLYRNGYGIYANDDYSRPNLFRPIHEVRPRSMETLSAISAPTRFAGRYHYMLIERAPADDFSDEQFYTLFHISVTERPPAAPTEVVRRYIGPSGSPSLSVELIHYRNKLVTLYTDTKRRLHYARLDNADPHSPWIHGGQLGRLQSNGNPSLALFNGRLALDATDFRYQQYGNDLFAVATPDTGAGSRGVSFLNVTRVIFQRELDRQFALLDDAKNVGGDAEEDRPRQMNLWMDERPVVTELGYLLWTLPNWIAETQFQELARRFCEDGTWTVENTNGRVSCDTEPKLPVIVKPSGDIFIYRGVWHVYGDDYMRLFEEVGHYLAAVFGFEDRGPRPGSAIADRTGVSIAELRAGYTLFGENVGGTSPTGRAPGFTGFGNNYDKTSRQHSFLYLVYYYLFDGDILRNFVSTDLASGEDLLARKYNWVKSNLFRGVEFKSAAEPR